MRLLRSTRETRAISRSGVPNLYRLTRKRSLAAPRWQPRDRRARSVRTPARPCARPRARAGARCGPALPPSRRSHMACVRRRSFGLRRAIPTRSHMFARSRRKVAPRSEELRRSVRIPRREGEQKRVTEVHDRDDAIPVASLLRVLRAAHVHSEAIEIDIFGACALVRAQLRGRTTRRVMLGFHPSSNAALARVASRGQVTPRKPRVNDFRTHLLPHGAAPLVPRDLPADPGGARRNKTYAS